MGSKKCRIWCSFQGCWKSDINKSCKFLTFITVCKSYRRITFLGELFCTPFNRTQHQILRFSLAGKSVGCHCLFFMYQRLPLCTLQFAFDFLSVLCKFTALGGGGQCGKKIYCTVLPHFPPKAELWALEGLVHKTAYGPLDLRNIPGQNSYLWTCDFYSPVRHAFDAGKSITWASGRRLGPGNSNGNSILIDLPASKALLYI